jgi:hypothetical protein
MQRGLSLTVVGVQHPNKRGPTRHFAIALCRPGDPVELRREPKNPKDENAVAVFNATGIQMGYLSAERAPWIGGMLLKNRVITAVFQATAGYGAVIRVAFDGEKPELPPVRESVGDDPDFYPDDIYPDD